MSIRSTWVALSIGLVSCMTLGACGDEAKPTPADPLAAVPASYARIVCAQAFSCCEAVERPDVLLVDPPPQSQAECESKLGAFVAAFFGQKREAVDAGRLVFHADRSGACFTRAEAVSCAEFFPQSFLDTDADCKAAFEGRVAVGGDCATDEECAVAGAICANSASGSKLGKCAILPGEGELCVDGRCEEGLACRFFAADGSLKCLTPTATGSACVLDDDCESGYCQSPANVCAAPATDGQTCSANAGCTSGYCDVMAGTCSAKKQNGAACATNTECTSGWCDDISASGVCSPKKADGAPCTVGGECPSGICDQGTCVAAMSGPVCDGI